MAVAILKKKYKTSQRKTRKALRKATEALRKAPRKAPPMHAFLTIALIYSAYICIYSAYIALTVLAG